MVFYFNSDLRQLVTGLGSNTAASAAYAFTRRDAANVDLQLFTGNQYTPVIGQLETAFEMRFGGKVTGNYPGPAIVYTNGFAWRPTDQVYRGNPSFGSRQLDAQFLSAANLVTYTASHTVALPDAGQLIATDIAGANTLTIAPDSTLDLPIGTQLWMIAYGAGITTVITAGLAITDAAGLGAVLTLQTPVLYTKTAANAWTLTKPAELAAVTLMGEFTWQNLSQPGAWTSVPQFVITVNNDVIRGNETSPTDAGAPTEYVTTAELAGTVVLVAPQSLSDAQKAQIQANLGIVSTDAVSFDVQSLTDPQKTQARTNTGAASEAELATLTSEVTDLNAAAVLTSAQTLSSPEKAQARSNIGAVSATDIATAITTAAPVSFTAQTLTAPQKAQALANIGAQPAGILSHRLSTRLNAIGNGTAVTLDGALNAATGTVTARSVSFIDAGIVFTPLSGNATTYTYTGTAPANGTLVQVTTTGTLPGNLFADTWYYVVASSGTSFGLAATLGGAAISRVIGSVFVNGSGTLHLCLSAQGLRQARRLGLVSAATAGAACGTRHNALQWAVANDPSVGGWTFKARFGISDPTLVTNGRLFVGMIHTAAAAVIGNVNPSTLTNLVGVSCDASQTTLRLITNDGTGTATTVDLGAPFPVNTHNTDIFELILTVNAAGTQVAYTVTRLNTGDTTSGTISADLPVNSMLLAPQLWRNNATTAAAVGLDVLQWSIDMAA